MRPLPGPMDDAASADGLRRKLLLLTLAAFASAAAFRVCDPMLPGLAEEFSASHGAVAQVITVFTIAYGAMQLIYGPLGERFERFRIIFLAVLACAIGSVGAALAPTLDLLLASRILSGVAGAGIIPLSMSWIADQVPAERRQATLARFFSGQILGMVFGQLVGGWCVELGAWRPAFLVLAGLYLAIAWALRTAVPAAVDPARTAKTPPGLGALYAAAFRLLLAPATRGVLLCFLSEAMLVFGVLAFIPLYVHSQHGLPLGQATFLLVLYGAGGLAFSVLAGRLGGRLNQARFPALAAGLMALADLLFLLGAHPAVWWLAAFVSGFGYYLLHNALLFQITQRVPQARSLALGLAISIFFVGQSLGVGLASLLVDGSHWSWLFAGAALLLPLLGLAVGRGIRPL